MCYNSYKYQQPLTFADKHKIASDAIIDFLDGKLPPINFLQEEQKYFRHNVIKMLNFIKYITLQNLNSLNNTDCARLFTLLYKLNLTLSKTLHTSYWEKIKDNELNKIDPNEGLFILEGDVKDQLIPISSTLYTSITKISDHYKEHQDDE